MRLPATTERVRDRTRAVHNRKIRQRFEDRIRHYAAHRDEIPQRLRELDREWDIERTLETNAASLAFLGVLLGLVNPWFLLIPAAVTAFLLQHALQGWCPPVNLFRRLGRRTQTEIEAERHALKALRGDYAGVGAQGGSTKPQRDAERVLEVVERLLPSRA